MNPQDITALWVTAKLAMVVTPILLALCLPLAAWLVYGRVRGRRYVEAAISLPMVLPPTVLGFGMLMLMSPTAPLGGLWEAVTGSRLPFSFAGLVMGSLVYSLPFGVLPIRAALEKIDPGIIEAARSQGLTRFQTFRYVVLPNALGGVTASAVLVFAHTVGEFGVALMIGGSIPGTTKVASIAIFEHTETLEYGSAGLLCLVLMVVSYFALLVIGRQSQPHFRSTPAPARRHDGAHRPAACRRPLAFSNES